MGGAAEAGFSQKFSEKPIPLSGSGDLLSEVFLTPEVTWPPAPLTLVPTAGVVVGNRGETLSREQSGRRRKGEKKKKKTRLKKSQALFRVFSKPLNSEA